MPDQGGQFNKFSLVKNCLLILFFGKELWATNYTFFWLFIKWLVNQDPSKISLTGIDTLTPLAR